MDDSLPRSFPIGAVELQNLIDRTRFAISTEETRYYLNGIYLHATESENIPVLRAVATDGHRLARFEMPLPNGAAELPGVIVPRKAVNELRKLIDESDLAVQVSLSETKIRFAFDATVLTSKLIDGTFPDYQRVIPSGNDKIMSVSCREFSEAVDRVSTISTEKSRAIKLALADGNLVLSATSPDSGSATEEIKVGYGGEDIEIGFNSRYLLDIAQQISHGEAEFVMRIRRLRRSCATSRTRARSTCSCPCGCELAALHTPLIDAGSLALDMPPTDQPGPIAGASKGRDTALWIARLRLSQFRSYARASLSPDGRPVVLTGPNGAGKTNLLEAVSLLAPGRGLRRANLADLGRRQGDAPWAVAARLATPEGPRDIGTGAEPVGPERRRSGAAGRENRRRTRRSQRALAEISSVVWLTPQMDGLFREGAAGRRRFPRSPGLCLRPGPCRSGSTAYEHALRERARVLKFERRDDRVAELPRGGHGQSRDRGRRGAARLGGPPGGGLRRVARALPKGRPAA